MEHEMAIVKLKRARNSLLNVSRLPPEVLGDIFSRNVAFHNPFEGLKEGSDNFLLVCHHWSQVALHTPEVWSFWGNNLQDWKKRHLRYPTAPLDLVLSGVQAQGGALDENLRNSLQDRVARNTIRRIHLVPEDSELLGSVISSLSLGHEGIRSSGVESVVLWEGSETGSVNLSGIDLSGFFNSYTFPKLRRLELEGCSISSWDPIMSRTTVLTTLSLSLCDHSPVPTTSQLFSILGSNPTLQNITLSPCAIPEDGGGSSSPRVRLPNLRVLDLTGDSRPIFELLDRLDHPTNMDNLSINLIDWTVGDISQVVGPYLLDYIRRRGRSRGLGLYLSSTDLIELHVGDVDEIDPPPESKQMKEFVVIAIDLHPFPSKHIRNKIILELIMHLPQEDITHLRICDNPVSMEIVSAKFPYLRTLHFDGTHLSVAFREPTPDGNGEIFSSLQRVILDWVVVRRGDWGPLTAFLARRASSGSPLDTLMIRGSYILNPRVEESFRRAVRDFRLSFLSTEYL